MKSNSALKLKKMECKKNVLIKKTGQIWVETAVYTLIGLTAIAIVLSATMPQIDKMKDKAILRQTTISFDTINSKLSETKENTGNIRLVDLRLGKGRIEIDSIKDELRFYLDNTRYAASEPGEIVREGDILIETKKYGTRFNIVLYLNYSKSLNITYENEDKLKTIQGGGAPYKIKMENIGYDEPNNLVNIDLSII
jgi:hypothetical protein